MILSPFVSQELELLLARINKGDLKQLAEYLESGAMRSVIDQEFALDEVPDAIRYSEAGRARGKIIISSD
jgi:NADPH:quinone reductase-like Zn-dependent oxidoreductase